jgi:hypothetical protein
MMVTRRPFGLGLFAALLPFLSTHAEPSASRYVVGQIWRYTPRPGDEGSLLKIGRVEVDPSLQGGQPIYHISVIGVHLGQDHRLTVIGHLPVSKETLDKSVIALAKSEAEFPDVAGGIEEWKRAKGGVFTISIADIVTFVDQTIQGKAAR